MALTENQKKANKLKIPWDENTSDEKLFDLIKLEEDKIEQEKEEQEIAKRNLKKAEEAKKKAVILRNIEGEDVDQKDYFLGSKNKELTVILVQRNGSQFHKWNRLIAYITHNY